MSDVGSNVEFARDLGTHGHHPASHERRDIWLGFVEVFVLSIVAIATAWSGYEAARWDAISAADYALYGRYTVLSQEKATLAGQEGLYDVVTFNSWGAAQMAGRAKLAKFYERRFRPEYATAFRAWLRLDPFQNLTAPPGPIFMPQYKNANALEASQLGAASLRYFKSAVSTRVRGDDYVRVTVLLATVLFLTALSQRFRFAGPRVALLVIAAVLLLVSIFRMLTLHQT
jgi:hypothetical protein